MVSAKLETSIAKREILGYNGVIQQKKDRKRKTEYNYG